VSVRRIPFLVDGHDVQTEQLGAGLFDVKQLEVLRGPQGTLYGRDAIGGVVNVTTNKPLPRYQAAGELEIGDFGENREFIELNVPLGDTLAVRGAFQREQRRGYLSSGSGRINNDAGRIELQYTPSSNFDALVTGSFTHQDSETANWVPRECGVPLPAPLTESPNCGTTPHKYGLVDSNNPWFDPQTDAGTYLHENGWSIATTLNYKFNFGPTLTFLGQYAHSDLQDVSNVAYNSVANQQGDDSNSEELRLSDDKGKGAGELKWLVGLYRFESETPFFVQIYPVTSQPAYYPVVPAGSQFFPPIPGAHISVQEPVVDQDSYAAFGQLTYSVSNAVRITAGGRYSSDREHGIEGDSPVGAPFFPPYTFNSHDYRHKQFNFKIGVDANVAPSSIVYANIQTGYLQGGFDLSSKPNFPGETMTEYSVGSKNRFLQNRLELNAEAFYYDYRDYQLSYNDPNSGAQEIFTAPKVKIYGVEFTTQYQLTQSDHIYATFNYLSAKIDEFTTPFSTTEDVASSVILIPGGTSLHGYSLIDAPKIATSAGYYHDWNFASGASLVAQVDTRFETKHYGEFQNSPAVTSPSFTKTDINLTFYAPERRWHASVYVRNLENSVEFGPGLVLASACIYPPRTYGMKVGFDF
jgi:iron complex outermembrane receptor protein